MAQEDLPMPSEAPPSAPFSMHARGVPMLERQAVCNLTEQVGGLGRQFRDVGSAFWTFILVQTWLTLFTIFMSICSISFFVYGPADDQFALDLSYISFLIILPTLISVNMAFTRRETALRQLASVKSGLLWVWIRTRRSSRLREGEGEAPGAGGDAAVQQVIWALTEALRVYLLTPRFYTRSYPYRGVRLSMVHVAQERVRNLRRITACFKKLGEVCEGCDDQLQVVHFAFECMANIKEYRLPQPLRAMTRFGVPVLIPVFVGPFWASYYYKTSSFAFALLVGTLLNVVVVAMLNIAIDLEDPFDNQGLDGVYCDEPFHELEQAILMDADAELEGPPPRASRRRSPATSTVSPWRASRRSPSPAAAAAAAAAPEAEELSPMAAGARWGNGRAHFVDDIPLSTEL